MLRMKQRLQTGCAQALHTRHRSSSCSAACTVHGTWQCALDSTATAWQTGFPHTSSLATSRTLRRALTERACCSASARASSPCPAGSSPADPSGEMSCTLYTLASVTVHRVLPGCVHGSGCNGTQPGALWRLPTMVSGQTEQHLAHGAVPNKGWFNSSGAHSSCPRFASPQSQRQAAQPSLLVKGVAAAAHKALCTCTRELP